MSAIIIGALVYLIALALICAFVRGASVASERMDCSEEIDTVTGRRG